MSKLLTNSTDINPTEGFPLENLRLFDSKRAKEAIRNHGTDYLNMINTLLEANEVIDTYPEEEQLKIIATLNHDSEIFNALHPTNIFEFIKIEMKYKKEEIEQHRLIATTMAQNPDGDLVSHTENNEKIMIKGSIKKLCMDIYQFLYDNKNRNQKYHISIDPATLRRVILSLFVNDHRNDLNTSTVQQYIPIKKAASQHTDNPSIKKQTKH